MFPNTIGSFSDVVRYHESECVQTEIDAVEYAENTEM
jgi:hypothetical protein